MLLPPFSHGISYHLRPDLSTGKRIFARFAAPEMRRPAPARRKKSAGRRTLFMP
ncbi:hypothetical protein HMPREF0372_03816 [Flavonifractor plautii ATCC 29863]|uniref:Uncharacterized protein n=1 Tax=Flavonifractor plautii ATCC 29863 TaxID=411475 RepID=G9YWA1_FLAPL|nr:hypothetical protein HMPREF0372_03816 [Flavonifractor plautii ATCC 29863]